METRTTTGGRKDRLYFIPLVAIVLGLVFLPFANAVQNDRLAWFFWDGGLVLIVVGILGGIISLGLYLWRVRTAKTPQ
ncbi:MAG: hypothetical protein NVSMB38_39580 [Ktedonobacteraceae bacterium]